MLPKTLIRTSAFRLALAYVGWFGLSSSLLLLFVYWATAGYMLRQSDETMNAEVQGLAETYKNSGLAGLARLIEGRTSREPAGPSIYLVADPLFRPIVGNLSGWPRESPDRSGWLEFDLSSPGHRARVRVFELSGGYRLLAGRDMAELDAFRSRMLAAIGWGSFFLVLMGGVGGLVVSRGRLRRIGVMNDAIARVRAGDLTQRIPLGRTDDDIERLTEQINEMLEDLERKVAGVRRVSDSIAHELRTPLARLSSRLEQALEEKGDPRELVGEASADADELLSIFSSLLRIARIETTNRMANFTTVNLSLLADDALELYQPLFDEADHHLNLEAVPGPIEVFGDRDLLFQALTNLLDNALKHTPPRTRVLISIGVTKGFARLCIADDGPGISAEEKDKVFERFYRAEGANSEGLGLGLSLVSAVAGLHQAELVLEENEPGTKVCLTLPLDQREPSEFPKQPDEPRASWSPPDAR